MLTLKDFHHVRTSQQIKGFRSCFALSGVRRRCSEATRLQHGNIALAIRRQHRSWIEKQWIARFSHGGERLRFLPPSTRGGQRVCRKSQGAVGVHLSEATAHHNGGLR